MVMMKTSRTRDKRVGDAIISQNLNNKLSQSRNGDQPQCGLKFKQQTRLRTNRLGDEPDGVMISKPCWNQGL